MGFTTHSQPKLSASPHARVFSSRAFSFPLILTLAQGGFEKHNLFPHSFFFIRWPGFYRLAFQQLQLNPLNISSLMPQSRLSRLPPWLSHWLGYRAEPPGPLPVWKVAAWSFITAFCGLSVIQAIFNYSPSFASRHVPGIIASYVSCVEFPLLNDSYACIGSLDC